MVLLWAAVFVVLVKWHQRAVGNLCAQILMSTFCNFATKLVASLAGGSCALLSTLAEAHCPVSSCMEKCAKEHSKQDEH